MAMSELKRTENSVLEGKEDVRIGVPRYFTQAGTDPFEAVEWETRTALIPGKDGPSFEQRDVEFPTFWSQTATNIVAQKYFRGKLNSPERERSVRQMIGRVADTITAWGTKDGYFTDGDEAETFRAELTHLLLHQMVAFNSPVWFNVGFEEHPQCSACFILSVEDNMESILDWIRKEGLVFRGGSGSGINLSKLRSSQEQLAKGGYASGPVSFMRGADASAGTIKSGGKTRRAAKMVVLNVDHPDIEEFIWCKQHEEEKARVLQAAGYDMSLDSPDWASIQYQNANNSVRVTDEFMRAVIDDADWDLTARTDGSVVKTRARPRPHAPDRRGGVEVRRSRHALRHDDERLAHLPGLRADQRLEPVLRVPARRQLGMQPRQPEPDEVPRPGDGRVPGRARSSGPSTSSSWPRRSWSRTRATRPRRSPRTRARCASSASASPTWAPC